MAIIPVTRDDVEHFTIVTTPRRSYVSGSSGVTGSINIFPRLSSIEKVLIQSDLNKNASIFGETTSVVTGYINLNNKVRPLRNNGSSCFDVLSQYLDIVHSASSRIPRKMEIERIVTTPTFTKNNLAKEQVKDILMSSYRTNYPHAHYAYTNYNSLNFLTISKNSTSFPTSSVLLYPNITGSNETYVAGYASGSYNLSGAFSFDFHINPRYQTDGLDAGHFKDGTIFHLSSSYALSLVTGSSKDARGLPLGFRLKLQLSHSADLAPSKAANGSYPNDLIFLSDDNALTWNNWHHVVVRWGTNTVNDGSGSFIVDGKNRGYFVVPSGTINPVSSPTKNDPAFLCIGNFYEGLNVGTNAQSNFFTKDFASDEGVEALVQTTNPEPGHVFAHPLKAELHDLIIKKYYVLDSEINASGTQGIGAKSLDKNKVAFYLPPFFTPSSPIRKYSNVRNRGGIIASPVERKNGSTYDPFSVQLSFQVDGHFINLENYTKDFCNSIFPRLIDLSGSLIGPNNTAIEMNEILYNQAYGQKGIPKRNLTILPCDDGKFEPSYELLQLEEFKDKYVDSLGRPDYSYVSLDKLVSSSVSSKTIIESSVPDYFGPSPSVPRLVSFGKDSQFYNIATSYVNLLGVSGSLNSAAGLKKLFSNQPLYLVELLGDTSSNQVTIFNISNLFFGRRILPGSFTLTDSALSGSEGAVKITLKDDSLGNLYRADANTSHATQCSVGNIFYDEGIVLVKNPHLYFFGKNQYEISFKGLNNIYTSKYEILAGSGQLNSSSNSTYARAVETMKASGDPLEREKFVYITTVNLHDENMNVIAKAKLAQPILKRNGDKILFKIALDS